MENVVTAFSFTPQEISDQLENQVPSVSKRISAMRRLAEKAGNLEYALIQSSIAKILINATTPSFPKSLIKYQAIPFTPCHWVLSVCLLLFQKMEKLYPSEPLFAGNFEKEAAPSVIQKKWRHKELEHADNYFFPAYLLKSSFSANRLKIKTFSDCHLRFFFLFSHLVATLA